MLKPYKDKKGDKYEQNDKKYNDIRVNMEQIKISGDKIHF